MPSNTVQIVAPDYQLWSLRSPECEGTAHIISTPNTLAVMEYVVRVPVCLDSQQAVIVLPPVPGHPVSAVTAGPVGVLAVGHVVLLQLVLHALLYPEQS